MKINRIKKEHNFVILGTEALRNKALSWAAKGLHSFIMQLPDSWDITVEGLAANSKTGRDATNTALKELIAAGYIERVKVKNKLNQFLGYEYNIFEEPQNGKAVNGKAVNGIPVNGKTATIKNEDINDYPIKELKNKSKNEFLQQTPSLNPSLEKQEAPQKEKNCAKKESLTEAQQAELDAVKQENKKPAAAEVMNTPTPEDVNAGVFSELRIFAAARQQQAASKRMTAKAWEMMQKEVQKASILYPAEVLKAHIEQARAKQYTSPFFTGYQEALNKLVKNQNSNNHATTNNPTNINGGNNPTTGEKLAAAFNSVRSRKRFG